MLLWDGGGSRPERPLRQRAPQASQIIDEFVTYSLPSPSGCHVQEIGCG